MHLTIAVKYAIFAAIATVANIIAQDISSRIYTHMYSLPIATLVGTGVGVFVKYLLDKNYIFNFQADSLQTETKTFILYSFMGVFTTLIFWGTEYAFHMMFETKTMRYVGAALGLSLGYFIKYNLDKRFVFGNSNA